MQSAMYLTDDRDLPLEDQRSLVIFPGGNGDWYVQVAPHHGRTTEGVRLCTSGGASSHCPGLTVDIAEAYRAMLAAQNGEKRKPKPSYSDLELEVAAWRAKAARYMYDQRTNEIVLRDCEQAQERGVAG